MEKNEKFMRILASKNPSKCDDFWYFLETLQKNMKKHFSKKNTLLDVYAKTHEKINIVFVWKTDETFMIFCLLET